MTYAIVCDHGPSWAETPAAAVYVAADSLDELYRIARDRADIGWRMAGVDDARMRVHLDGCRVVTLGDQTPGWAFPVAGLECSTHTLVPRDTQVHAEATAAIRAIAEGA